MSDTTLTWRGKRVEGLTREEMLAALRESALHQFEYKRRMIVAEALVQKPTAGQRIISFVIWVAIWGVVFGLIF
jgi:hypothetical protein